MQSPVTVTLPTLKVVWVSSSHKDLCSFPDAVKRQFGFTLGAVQRGVTNLKHIKVWAGSYAKSFEIKLSVRGDTFRFVYTTRRNGLLFVLHVFQKKSHQGSATPREHIETINHRQRAVDIHKE